MKPIINIDFTDEIDFSSAIKIVDNLVDLLNKDYYVIGTFKPFMEIKELNGEDILFKFNAKDYTVEQIIEILEGRVENDRIL